MSIFNMISNTATEFPEGAYCCLSWTEDAGMPIVLYESHKGVCLSESEQNGRDDSDFFMRVWNEEKQCVQSIMFATTRGWSYPCLASHVDATPEVCAKAEAWGAEQRRRQMIIGRWRVRKEANKEAKDLGISRAAYLRLKKAVHRDVFPLYVKLLKVKNFRSSFRENMAKQVRQWLADAESKYSRPLSLKQEQYI